MTLGNPGNILAVLFVLAIWAVAGYAVWFWGPGLRPRKVWCPVLKKYTQILAEQKEAKFRNSYAGLAIVDVKRCPLLGGAPYLCDRECLS